MCFFGRKEEEEEKEACRNMMFKICIIRHTDSGEKQGPAMGTADEC